MPVLPWRARCARSAPLGPSSRIAGDIVCRFARCSVWHGRTASVCGLDWLGAGSAFRRVPAPRRRRRRCPGRPASPTRARARGPVCLRARGNHAYSRACARQFRPDVKNLAQRVWAGLGRPPCGARASGSGDRDSRPRAPCARRPGASRPERADLGPPSPTILRLVVFSGCPELTLLDSVDLIEYSGLAARRSSNTVPSV